MQYKLCMGGDAFFKEEKKEHRGDTVISLFYIVACVQFAQHVFIDLDYTRCGQSVNRL